MRYDVRQRAEYDKDNVLRDATEEERCEQDRDTSVRCTSRRRETRKRRTYVVDKDGERYRFETHTRLGVSSTTNPR